MSDKNEKFFSESKIKDEPKKKLSLKLGDGVVTTDKIHDGAVTEDKLASQSVTADKLNDNVISIMSSIEAGGVPLEQKYGNHENLGISQKFLTKEIGEEYDSSEDTVKGHIKAIEDSIGTGEEGSGTIKDRISSLETAVEAEDGSVNSRINAMHDKLNDGLQDEIDRATNIEGGLRNDVSDINDTLTQDLGFAPAGVNKSAHERITDLVEEGIRTVSLGQAALDETPVQGHNTTVVTSDGLFNRFADITKELEPILNDGENSVIANDKRTLNSFIINTTSSTITEVQTENNKIVLYNRPFNKGTIIHFEGSYTNNAAVVCFAFSRNNIYAYNDSAIADVPVDVVYYNSAASHNTDVVVPYDNAYCIFAYYYNSSGNKLSTTSRVIYPAGALKESIANLNKNMYQIVLNGTGNTMTGSIVRSVTFGHTYRLHLKDPNISMAGISYSTSGYNKLLVNEKVNGNTDRHPNQPLVKVTMDKALEEYYDFTIPELSTEEENDGYTAQTFYITINMRAAFGAAQTFIIEDITETTKLKKDVDEIGLKEGITVFPDLAIGDEEGNDIVWFEDGHVKTKNFDSSTVDSNLRESIDGILPTISVKYSTASDGVLSSAGGQGLTFGTSITVPSSDASSQYVRFFKDRLSKGSVITISRNPGSHSLTFRFAYSTSDPNDYLSENENSLVGFELSGVKSKSWSSSDYTSVYTMPEDGWLFTRFYNVEWASGSSWNCTVQYSDTVGRLQEKVDSVGISQESAILPDLAFGDANGNDVVWFENGHIRTKNFDSSKGGNVFKPYQRVTYFTVNVDCTLPIDDNFAATAANVYKSERIYTDNAFLYLPSSYKAQGTPTRLVMFGKQGGSLVTSNSTPLFDTNYLNISHFLLHLGYALLIVDGTPDEWALDMTGRRYRKRSGKVVPALDGYQNGAYPCIQSARRAYDYVVENYNIDKTGVFGWGYSQGGWMIMNIAELSGIPFLAVCLKSPLVSLEGMWNGTQGWTEVDSGGNTISSHPYRSKYLMTKVYGIADILAQENGWTAEEADNKLVDNVDGILSGLSYDTYKERWAGYDPLLRYADSVISGNGSDANIDITAKRPNKFPIKIWIAQNDGNVGHNSQCRLIKAMKNAGCVADIHQYTSGGHGLGPDTFRDTEGNTFNYCLGTFDDNGTNYWLYPPTYEMAMWFHQHGGLPLDFVPISEGGEGGDDSSSDEDDD